MGNWKRKFDFQTHEGATVLLADSLLTALVQLVQTVVLAVIAGYVAIKTRQLDIAARKAELRAARRDGRVDDLQSRIQTLEALAREKNPAHPCE